MNIFRLFVVSLTFLFLAGFSVSAQEAVGERPNSTPEDVTQEEQPSAEATAATTTDEAPVKKAKPKPKIVTEDKPKSSSKGIDGMTPEQFKAAGLDKLSPEELANLDASLKGYQRKVETKAVEKANAAADQKVEEKLKVERRKGFEHIESRVDGTLTRLTGHSIITLEDGTRWKQANPEDNFRSQVVDHPTAIVTRGAFGYKMRIAGLPDIYVDPVRN